MSLHKFYLITKDILDSSRHSPVRACLHCQSKLQEGYVLCSRCNRLFDHYQDGEEDIDLYSIVKESDSFDEFKLNVMMGKLEI